MKRTANLGYIERPPGLVGRDDVGAFRVCGDCMAPHHGHGSFVCVDRRRVKPGDVVVIELRRHENGEPKSYVKELLSLDSMRVACRQYNPAVDLFMDRRKVLRIWRVIPDGELWPNEAR